MLTLSLGIGASTTVFTIVDNFLFRPPPFEHVERLVSIRDVNPAQGWTSEDDIAASPGNFLDCLRPSLSGNTTRHGEVAHSGQGRRCNTSSRSTAAGA